MDGMHGTFDLVSNPVRFERNQLGVWEICTEDGIDFIVVPAVRSFYDTKVKEAERLQSSQEEVLEDVVQAEHEQPVVPHSVREYVGAQNSIRNCLLVIVAVVLRLMSSTI